MFSLADLPELVGFFSYSRSDDQHSGGALSRLRSRIHDELRLQLGRDVRLWQDTAAIPDCALWADEIKRAIAESAFFIPIVTPSAVGSAHCKYEFDSFLKREKALGRQNLVFPILYIRVPGLEDERERQENEVFKIICARQYVDWQKLRLRDWTSTEVAERIEQFGRNVVDALRQPWVTPEERQRRDQAEARRKAEEEQRQQEEGRRRQTAAEAERQRLEREAATKREAEERARQAAAAEAERQRQERDAAATREGEEKTRQEERRKKEEDERRREEAEAERRTEQERSFAAAKRTDAVSAVDAFLATYPESHLAGEARALRAMLLARDDAYKGAMASDDPAELKAFLIDYPKSAQADEVRRRLRRLEPRNVWRPSRPVITVVATIVLLIFGIAGWRIFARHPMPQLPVTVAGQLTVSGSESFMFTGPEGGPFSPPRLSLEVKAVGPAFHWSTDGTIPQWLKVTPDQGDLATNGSAEVAVTLSAVAQSLSPGRYESQLVFKNSSNGSSALRGVSLVVSPRPQSPPLVVVTPPATGGAVPLSADRERALRPKDSFKECDKCPEMIVVPAGSFTMGSRVASRGAF
jgi:hypothetical protein